ncbi:MAG: helix-turn-helix transcriptional regulator [Clostridia bacterium]|nr:helix-turn-helix transcriptional regulator [Clostridia bacterium]
MKDVRPIISKNLAILRKEKGLTQAELAEKLNYSDKAISRWEHGDTLPDVNVLCELCDFYGITLNNLTSEDCEIKEEEAIKYSKEMNTYKIWRCILSASIVWLLATLVFTYYLAISGNSKLWILFVWAVPVSGIAFYIFGKGFLNSMVRFILSSSIMWTIIASVFCSLLPHAFWQLFLIGVPLELIIFLTYKMKKYK